MFVQKVISWIMPHNQIEKYEYEEGREQAEYKNKIIPDDKENIDLYSPVSDSSSYNSCATSILPLSSEAVKNEADYQCLEREEMITKNFDDNDSVEITNQALEPPEPINGTCLFSKTYPNNERSRSPVLSEADLTSTLLPTPRIADISKRRDSHEKSIAVRELSPLCNRILSVKTLTSVQSNRPKRSTFTQTDKFDKRHADRTSHRPLFSILKSAVNKAHFTPGPLSNRMGDSREEDIVLKKDSSVEDPTVYGELLVLGCNGTPPAHLCSRMKSKFVLRKRHIANGLKEAFPQQRSLSCVPSKLIGKCDASKSRSVVTEYISDKSTDMFQIGCYESSPVDFKVLDVNAAGRARNGVSRFACRIVVERQGHHEAKVIAAAFDSTGKVFLGEGGISHVREGRMDGFTTNGVLIMHPQSEWREVSVSGFIYPIRSSNVEPQMRPRLEEESNILRDGTLIDLCGVTLLWRTLAGRRDMPTSESLKRYECTLQGLAPECEVVRKYFLQNAVLSTSCNQTFVFLSCGHVMSLKVKVTEENCEGWSCPICRCVGPIASLQVGVEPGLYVDNGLPTHAFRPCGHVASFKTVQHWASQKIPEHRSMQQGFCPFCLKKLDSISKYVELSIP